MAEDLQKLIIQLDAQTAMMERNLRAAASIVDRQLGNIDKRVQRTDNLFNKWGKSIARSIQVGLTVAVLAAGKNVLGTADKIDVLQDRIKDATRESGGFEKVWSGISKTAIKTGSSLETNVELVQRLAIAGKDLGGTNDQFIKLNDTVQKLGIIGGSSASALAAGTTQLAQGLGSGILRAEEFNSIIENIPAVANEIAKQLGMSTAELRKMVLAGKITSKEVFDALLSAGDAVDKRYSEIPPRLERAWSGFLNAISLKIDDVNDKFGLTEALARSLTNLTNAMSGPDYSAMPGGQEYNDLLDEQYNLQKKIDEYTPGFGFWYEKWNKDLTEVNAKLKEITQSTIKGAEAKADLPTPAPRATPDYIQPSMKDLNRDKPDNPNIVAADRTAEITNEISRMTAQEALRGAEVGKTAAEVARMNAEFEINQQLAKDGINLSTEQREAMRAQLDMYQQELEATAASKKSFDEIEARMQRLDDAANQFAEDFGNIFVNSVANGTNAIDALKNAFKNALIKMAADALIINPLKQLFSPKGGNLFGAFFGGFFADGGNPPMGKVSVVGEQGPELFIPKSAGTIVPNHKIGGSGKIQIINQTTGRIDSVQQQTMSDGRVRMIIREELPGGVAAQVAAQNSPFNKTFRANNSVTRRF